LSNKEKLAYMEARTLSERERRVIREGGYIIGKEDGFAEGMERGKQLVVKAMLAKGVPADTIAEALGLPTEDVLKMQ
jgi:predicted transposase/invertase (TIGR01784 family)